ncbi:MAG TPA: PAS domain S-box protein [Candidatus Binatia bacterium]|nr:PAS domain S-box protein [Candidatus Binatia bacterium]
MNSRNKSFATHVFDADISPAERELAVFFETAPIGLHWVAADGTILRVNRAELEMLGCSAAECVGRSIAEFHVDQAAIEDLLGRLAAGEVVRGYRTQMRRKDGSVRDVVIDSSGYWEEGQFVHTQCFTRDVTQERAAEITERRLAAIVESSDDGIVGKTLEGIVTSWNRAAERIFGYLAEEMIGESINKIIPPGRLSEETYILSRLSRGERIEHYETVRIRKDGRPLDVEITSSPIRDGGGRIVGASKIARDITRRKAIEVELSRVREDLARVNAELERRVAQRGADLEAATAKLMREMERQKLLEEKLRDAQKMESLGTLAAGIAHDFNNILNIILGYTSLLPGDADDAAKLAEDIDIIKDAVNRGAAIVQQLLTIGRKSDAQFEPIEPNEFLKHHALLLDRVFPPTIVVSLDLDAEAPAVLADPTRLGQAVLNLSVNARDAMSGSGTLTLGTERVDGPALRNRFVDATADQYVCISVSDSGPGIPAAVLSRIFEPFFTTKERGSGTGLGLSVTYGIVRDHGGFIDVESASAGGAAFRIFLPVDSPAQ